MYHLKKNYIMIAKYFFMDHLTKGRGNSYDRQFFAKA